MEEHPEKPFILCEYCHAMGNSCGALEDYTEFAWQQPRYQGGFIWDYIDQGLVKTGPDGKEYMAWGGDYGDAPCDYNFCGNGLVFADRTNTPKMQEVKACYQDFVLDVTETGITVTNRCMFTDAADYQLVARLYQDGWLEEELPLELQLAPGETVTLPLPFALPENGAHISVDAAMLLRRDTLWAEAGYEVAFGQMVIHRGGELPCSLLPVELVKGLQLRHQGRGFLSAGLPHHRRFGVLPHRRQGMAAPAGTAELLARLHRQRPGRGPAL